VQTISDVLRHLDTVNKLLVLMRADRLLTGPRCGRYYMGPISSDESEALFSAQERRQLERERQS